MAIEKDVRRIADALEVIARHLGVITEQAPPHMPDAVKNSAPDEKRGVRETWLTAVSEVWEGRNGAGTFTPRLAGRCARGLAPLTRAGHEPPEIARRLALYLDGTERRFWNVDNFAQTFGQWDGALAGNTQTNGLSRAQIAVQRILALVTRTQQPGQAPVVCIPKPRVVELGPEIAGAYDRVGGASRFLGCEGDKIGLLTRDFAIALAVGSDATV